MSISFIRLSSLPFRVLHRRSSTPLSCSWLSLTWPHQTSTEKPKLWREPTKSLNFITALANDVGRRVIQSPDTIFRLKLRQSESISNTTFLTEQAFTKYCMSCSNPDSFEPMLLMPCIPIDGTPCLQAFSAFFSPSWTNSVSICVPA